MSWPRVGLGCWQLGGATRFGGRETGWGELDDAAAAALLARAAELGIRLYDTADAYGHGASERRLGSALANARGDAPIVITKVGQRDDGASARVDFSGEWLLEAVAASRQRLQRARIDVLLLHSPPDDFDWQSFDRAPLERLIDAGAIGAWGVSARTRIGAERAITAGAGSVVELIYNALDRRPADIVLPLAAARGFKVIARCPLASGFLAHHAPRQFDHRDHRAAIGVDERAWRDDAARRFAVADALPGGRAVTALRFAMSHPAVTTVIAGARIPAQLDALVAAERLGPLDAGQLDAIARALPSPYPGWP